MGFEPGLRSLLETVIEEEGYTSRTIRLGANTADDLTRSRPDLLLVEAGIYESTQDSDALVLLDALRATPETNAIPVVVLGTLEPTLEQAQASGNVYAVLPEPFDLDDLVNAVKGALARTPFEARVLAAPVETDRAFGQAADILLRSERSLMLDWVQRIRGLDPFAARTDISTREFLDSVPRLLNVLALVLRHQVPPDVLTKDDEVLTRIRVHAQTRWSQGIPTVGVVRDYHVLREVMIGRLQREMAAEDVLTVLHELNSQIDQAVQITIAEYERLAQTKEEPA